MPYVLTDLVVDRVDLVDEGANSAAFIELYKRKEKGNPMDFNEILSKMKPEHAEVVNSAMSEKDAELTKAREDLAAAEQSLADKDTELTAANDALAKANAELETLKAKGENCECDGEAGDDGMCKSCGKPKVRKSAPSEEDILKGMPESARALFEKMRAQKDAAEEQVRKAAEKQAEDEAIAKAASLKAIPVAQDVLVGVVKNCSPEVLSILEAANAALETAVLDEVGKNRGNGAGTNEVDPWAEIEKKAEEIAKRDNVTKEKAIATAVSENPELYKQYLKGGAN